MNCYYVVPYESIVFYGVCNTLGDIAMNIGNSKILLYTNKFSPNTFANNITSDMLLHESFQNQPLCRKCILATFNIHDLLAHAHYHSKVFT